jgi:hypothetical protein
MIQTMPSPDSLVGVIEFKKLLRHVGQTVGTVSNDRRLAIMGGLVDAMLYVGMTKEDVIELLNCVADELAGGEG